jgi:hypothetical protein
MDDDARATLGTAPLSSSSRGTTPSRSSQHPLALAALVGLVVAAVPSLDYYLLSEPTIRAAGEHARPLIALVLVAPLATVMLVAATVDWLGGRGSPLAAVRHLSAIALVVACFFVAVLGMEQPDALTVGGGFLLIGGAIGLGIAFALGGIADSSGPLLAMVGWAGCALPLVLQEFVIAATAPSNYPNGRLFVDPRSFDVMLSSFTSLVALVMGVTVVPLGGWLGGWLSGHR